MYRLLASTAAIAVAATSAQASAQETTAAPVTGSQVGANSIGQPTPPPAQQAEPAAGLKDIVVTARRREESLQRAAIPIDVVNPGSLVNGAVTQPTQLGQLVPSLSVQSVGGASAAFFLRGVGNFTTIGYSDPAIAFNYDGVYIGRATSTSGTFYDLDRVEVLKGPQGTLYGRNATAGAINVIPAKPVIGQTSGSFNASYGNYDAKNVQAAVNMAVGDRSALRLAGNVVDQDGYLTDGTSDNKTQSGRAQFLTHAIPGLSIRIAGDYSHTGGRGPGGHYEGREAYDPASGGYDFIPSGLNRDVGTTDPLAQAYRTTLYSPLAGRQLGPVTSGVYENDTFYGFNGEINYDTGAGTLTIIPAYRHSKLDSIYNSYGFDILTDESARQTSVEARFNGKRLGIFDYIIGFYYFDEKVLGLSSYNQQVFQAFAQYDSRTQSYAGFARLTAHLSDKLRLVGGIRYTRDDKTFNGAQDTVTVICVAPTGCPTLPLLPLRQTAGELPLVLPPANTAPAPVGATGGIIINSLTPVDQPLRNSKPTFRAGVEYDLGPRSLAYASFETGYRSGGYSLAYGYETFRPEYIDAYTIGSKNRFFGNRVELNVEGFIWKYRDQQVTHQGLDLHGVQAYFTENVGRSTIKGVEVEGQVLATQNTLVATDIQYLDATFDSFAYSVPTSFTPPVVGCPYRVNSTIAALTDINCSGQQAYQSPKWTINLNGQQTFPITSRLKVVLAANTQYRSGRWTGFDYLGFERAPAEWRSNASLTLATVDDRWSIGGFVNNIENRRVLTSSLYGAISMAGTIFTTSPRIYGVRLAGKF